MSIQEMATELMNTKDDDKVMALVEAIYEQGRRDGIQDAILELDTPTEDDIQALLINSGAPDPRR